MHRSAIENGLSSFLKTGDPVLHGDGYGDEGDGKVVVEY